jgi:signal peptidase II
MNRAHLLTIGAVVGLDRISKYLVERYIPLDSGVDVLPGLFRLTHLRNPGGAFSLFADSAASWRTPALILITLVALIIILVLLWKNRETNAGTIALALIFGGALGNLWDRVAHGEVTDFLDFYIGSHHWYPFNIADSAIVIGALLLALKTISHSNPRVNG